MARASSTDEVRIELPFTARIARLVRPEAGIERVEVLRGPAQRWSRQETLLDAADFRLVRAGIILTHRVSDGRGDWNLSAPTWEPWLPADLSLPMSDGDLPAELARMIRPFRRDSPLTPVAALEVDHWTYELQGAADDHHLGTVVDKFVTVRTGGVTTARFREVVLDASALSAEQRDWVVEVLELGGGTVVPEFPPLATRIGSPATGRTDFPPPAPWDRRSRIDVVIGSLLAARLQLIIIADLSVRSGGPATALAEQLEALATELRGLAPFLRQRRFLPDECSALAERLAEADPDQALAVINSGKYLLALDTLVRDVRAPRLLAGIDTDHPPKARDAFGGLLERVGQDFAEACDQLGVDAEDEVWRVAEEAGQQVITSAAISQLIKPRRSLRIRQATKVMLKSLKRTWGEDGDVELAGLSPVEAFEAGRKFERRLVRRGARRAAAVATWSELRGEFE